MEENGLLNKKLVVVVAYIFLIHEYEMNDYLDYARNSSITIVIQQIQL